MKKYCLLILVVCLLLTLCGCSSKEAKNVITMIENLENIDENSKTQIDEVFEAYNALDEKDKKAVSNIEDLYAAQKEFEEYIPKYVSQKVSDYRFASRINYDELKQFVSDYYDCLDDDQIEIIGCAIGKCKIQDLVVSKVQESMKNPSSFELVSFDPGYIMRDSKGVYSTLIKITFRGTNSFGGVVPNTISGTIDFNVDFNNCTISYVDSFFM